MLTECQCSTERYSNHHELLPFTTAELGLFLSRHDGYWQTEWDCLLVVQPNKKSYLRGCASRLLAKSYRFINVLDEHWKGKLDEECIQFDYLFAVSYSLELSLTARSSKHLEIIAIKSFGLSQV